MRAFEWIAKPISYIEVLKSNSRVPSKIQIRHSGISLKKVMLSRIQELVLPSMRRTASCGTRKISELLGGHADNGAKSLDLLLAAQEALQQM
jgi:hypothetical protein